MQKVHKDVLPNGLTVITEPGDVSVSAGGNINNLSVSAATSGYLDAATKQTVVLGGGDVSVSAGGNINSGIFYVGKGQGTIRAGGALGTSNQIGTGTTAKFLHTVLALGQGNFEREHRRRPELAGGSESDSAADELFAESVGNILRQQYKELLLYLWRNQRYLGVQPEWQRDTGWIESL